MQQLSAVAEFLRRYPEIRVISLLLAALAWIVSAVWDGGWMPKPSWASTTVLSLIGQVLLVASIFLQRGTISAATSTAASKASKYQFSQVRLLGITITAFLTVGLAFVGLVADLILTPPIFLFGLIASVGMLGIYLLLIGKMSPFYAVAALGLGAVSILPLWGIPSNYYESTGHISYVKLCIGLLVLTLALAEMVSLRRPSPQKHIKSPPSAAA